MPCPDGALCGGAALAGQDSGTPVPHPAGRRPAAGPRRRLTGRNVETLKELPAQHRLLEDKAVEVTVVKRRRGAAHWHDQATWEIGPPSRRLHTPGGFYLLLCRLTESSRAFSGSSDGLVGLAQRPDRAGHRRAPGPVHWTSSATWSRCATGHDRHDLRGDDGRRLKLDMDRLRTSVEVRRTRQLGGHLPSAARTNTMQTLWSSYLRGDPAVTEWAEEILDDGVRRRRARALDAHAGRSPPTRARSGSSRHSAGQAAGPPRRAWMTMTARKRRPGRSWTRAGPRAPGGTPARGMRDRARRRSWTASTAGTP